MPDFRSVDFLRQHTKTILDFYQPNVVDRTHGGLHQNFYDDGSVFSAGRKHLVSSTRMVFNYCNAYRQASQQRSPEAEVYRELATAGLDYIREYHWDEQRQGYHWILDDNRALDSSNHCYGLAFVILALSSCLETDIADTRAELYRAWNILNDKLWQPDAGLYADEASPDWKTLSPYRGQNANMHCCEALLAAYQATGDAVFFQRAYQLAETVAVVLADKSQGLIWEHFTESLDIDWDYNRDDPKNLYRPWGFQPGHQTEWSKLLLLLYRVQPEAWMLERAQALFDRALDTCWDEACGGIFYGHDPEGRICDSDKYFWVQAESFAAAAMLAEATGEARYWQWYDRIWEYCWQHFVDHQHGAWYRLLDCDNKKTSNEKSVSGGKCDYHTLGACWEVMRVLAGEPG